MEKQRLCIAIDTTGSMQAYLTASKEAIQIMYPFLPLLKIEEIIIVTYGDFDSSHTQINQVVEIFRNVTPGLVNCIKLCQVGGGGDHVEALNTGLFKILKFLQQQNPTPIIVMHDACGYTKLDCNCNSDPTQRDLEFKALEREGINKSDATTEYFVKQLAERHLVTCITSNRCPANAKMYSDNGGYCDVISQNVTDITSALFKMLTDILNLSPSTQRTRPIKTPDGSAPAKITWTIDDINLFRKLILQNGTIMEHVSGLASLYYTAIRQNKDMVRHAEFMKELANEGVSAAVRNIFKEAQNELNKVSIDIFQKAEEQGPRIIGNKTFLTGLLEMLTCTGKGTTAASRTELKELIKSIKIIDIGDPRFSEGFPLSIITGTKQIVNQDQDQTIEQDESSRLIDGLSLLISYLGRDGNNYLVKVYNRPALALLMACLLSWTRLYEITDVVGHIIKNGDFLQSDKLILSASAYNMSWLITVVTAFRKIMPDNNMHKLYKMYMLVTILEMSKKSVEFTSRQEVEKMTINALIEYVPGVMMFYCVALRQWYPACLACKCNKSTVEDIIKQMVEYNIGTNEYHTALRKLCDKNEFIFLSTYAIYFYKDLPDNPHLLDPFMYNTRTHIEMEKCDETTLNDIYDKYVGGNGEHIFSNCVPHSNLTSAENCICTQCGALYGVSDTRKHPPRRCATCRFNTPIKDDRRPTSLIKTYLITCENGHKFVCNYERTEMIATDVCPFCSIDLNACTNTKTYLVEQFFIDNIEYVALALGISESILSRLMTTKSAYKTAVCVETETINPDFAKWLPSPFICKTPEGKHIVRIAGCPLTDASCANILSLMKQKFCLRCMCCSEKKSCEEFKKVCSRANCIFDICSTCVQSFHPCHIGNATDEQVYNGSLSISVLSCSGCRSPIDPDAKMLNYGLVRFIFKNNDITTLDGSIYNSIAAAVFAGVPFWRCSNGPNCLSLRNKANHGIFEVPKLACDQIDENPHHICEACVQQQMALAKQQAEEARARMLELTPDKDDYGFFIIDGERCRQCPNCNAYAVRTIGCAHMTCVCGQHYCYCCGLPHANPGETYAHIRQLFRGEIYPSKEQIEEVIRLRKTDPDAILPDIQDTYYGDEETDSDEEYD